MHFVTHGFPYFRYFQVKKISGGKQGDRVLGKKAQDNSLFRYDAGLQRGSGFIEGQITSQSLVRACNFNLNLQPKTRNAFSSSSNR